jgi:hypothetical protein
MGEGEGEREREREIGTVQVNGVPAVSGALPPYST